MEHIAKALAAAQQEMDGALKQSENPHFRSKYADLGNVIDACMPALNKHGIAVVQPIESTELGSVVKTVLIHESGESLSCSVPLILGKQDMQGFGSAVTYARRYGLMAMAGIAPEDDDGNQAVKSTPAGAALRDAWKQGVEDALPVNATPEQKAKAYADAICADFEGKGEKALHNRWNNHKAIIENLEKRFPALHEQVVDAFENRMIDLQKTAAKKPEQLNDEVPY